MNKMGSPKGFMSLSEEDVNIDKFATLFQPATPRASPTLITSQLPSTLSAVSSTSSSVFVTTTQTRQTIPSRRPTSFHQHLQLQSQRNQRRESSFGADSEDGDDFGAFVSVPATEDPLGSAVLLMEFPENSPITSTLGEKMVKDGNLEVVVEGGNGAESEQRERGVSPGKNGLSSWTSQGKNASLHYFDKFTQDAKVAAEKKKKDYLDELLLHEQDPSAFLKRGLPNQGRDSLNLESPKALSEIDIDFFASPNLSSSKPAKEEPKSSSPLSHEKDKPTSASSSSAATASTAQYRNLSQSPEHPIPKKKTSETSLSGRHIRRISPTISPSRSPTLGRSALAPPVSSSPAITGTNTSMPDGLVDPLAALLEFEVENPESASQPKRPEHPRSGSYQTLSTISSKLISSLMATKPGANGQGQQQHPTRQDSKSSLEALFAAASEGTHNPSPAHRDRYGQHSRSRSASGSLNASTTPPKWTHGTPFGPAFLSNSSIASLSSSFPAGLTASSSSLGGLTPSPFAPHVYLPPSGAPGFKGESYDWDKGYSEELEDELRKEREERGRRVEEWERDLANERRLNMGGKDHQEGNNTAAAAAAAFGQHSRSATYNGSTHASPAAAGIDRGRRIRTPTPPRAGLSMSELIEKKAGSIELRGRKPLTTEVLTVPVADALRLHLPALARLPKAWTLLYSLDQHGVLLNTLYTKCEAHRQLRVGASGIMVNPGALVVVKDSDDGVFGAWIGEGIRQSKGKGYYGSGESFLWKHHPEEEDEGGVQVFKWTGRNDYVALCEPGSISFGGGDGHYGLYLDESLFNGSSARCPTFDNEPLCSPGPMRAGMVPFECMGLEVWGVDPNS